MRRRKFETRVNEPAAGVFCVAALIVCLFMSIFGVVELTKVNSEKMDNTENTAVVQSEAGNSKTQRPKYVLNDPVFNIEETATSDISEKSETRKSNRLEDIVDVLSDTVVEEDTQE